MNLSWEYLLRINARKRYRALREGKDMEQAFQQKKRGKKGPQPITEQDGGTGPSFVPVFALELPLWVAVYHICLSI